MITVTVTEDEISVTGHAHCGPPGQDIVCASVSTLIQTLIASLDNLTEDRIKYKIEHGKVILQYGHLSDHGRILMNAFFIGVERVAETEPKHVKICLLRDRH